uniref:Protein phosphatase 1 regulatory inhibitor subunit 16a, putative n=1 Tax=Schistosoma mansoni TaxID=6183 RepID=A0A3Q0KGC6_SCHMA
MMDNLNGSIENVTINIADDIDLPGIRVPDMKRIKNARKERANQLKEWQIYDKKMQKESEKLQKKGLSPLNDRRHYNSSRAVKFPQSLIFLEAAARGDLDEVRELLSSGVCPDVANEDGLTALHQCCIDNNLEMCRLLLRYGANPNSRDTELWTPLHASATCHHTEMCKILIDHGADLLAMNVDGNMPYECCMPGPTLNLVETEMDKRGITQEEIDDWHRVPECEMLADMEALYKAGADLDRLDAQGASMLHIAAASGFEEVVLFLLKRGAKIDLLDKDGWQAIHIAACWCQLEIVELLVNFGADILAETRNGETVFDICEDIEMHTRLIEIKQEVERKKSQQQDLLNKPGKPRELVRRRSSTNPRSASIRRTSMREKKMISWKEAKQEAEMRGVATTSSDEKNTSKPLSPILNGSTDHILEKSTTYPESHGLTSPKPIRDSTRSSHPGHSSKSSIPPVSSPILTGVLTHHGSSWSGKVQQNDTVTEVNGSTQSPNLRNSSRMKDKVNLPRRNNTQSTLNNDSGPIGVVSPSPVAAHRTSHDKERIVRVPSGPVQNPENVGTLTRRPQQTEYGSKSPPISSPDLSPQHHTLSPQLRQAKSRTISGVEGLSNPDQSGTHLKARVSNYDNAYASSLPRRDNNNQKTDLNNQPVRGERRSSTRKKKPILSEQKPPRNDNRETDISVHNAYCVLPSNNQFQNNQLRNDENHPDYQNIILRSPNINRNDVKQNTRSRITSGQQSGSGQVVHATASLPRRELINYGDDLGSRPSGKCCIIM